MGLETGTYVDDLVVTNPLGTDAKSAGDDHLRLIKTVLKNSFPDVDEAVATIHVKATAPSTTQAGMIWFDTTADLLKLRNKGDTDWVTLAISPITSNSVDINAGTIDTITSLDVTGNITVGGTVDGRDVATDGTKLDTFSGDQAEFAAEDTSGQSINSATPTDVNFATELFDTGADYDGTKIFTAPATGNYQFNINVCTTSVGISDGDLFRLDLVTTSKTYRKFHVINGGLSTESMSMSVFVNLTSGNTAKVQISRASGSGTWTMTVTAGQNNFSGFLIR